MIGLSAEENDLLHRNLNVVRRFKRQQIIFPSQSTAQPNTTLNQPVVCGINGKSQKQVKSNKQSDRSDWPWMAVLLHTNYREHFCGGVLLNRNYVLTAAHCVEGKTIEAIRVRLGEYDFLAQNETESLDSNVAEIKIHRDYDPATQQHDIALLKLNRTIKYSQFIRPVCLPTVQIKINQTAIVTGWGMTYYGGPFSEVLLEVQVPVWELENCISKYSQSVFETNICAAGYEGKKDSCSGDSGGPLLVQEPNGRWVVIGIVSWGIRCGDKDQPGVYTSVDKYLNWIREKTRDAFL